MLGGRTGRPTPEAPDPRISSRRSSGSGRDTAAALSSHRPATHRYHAGRVLGRPRSRGGSVRSARSRVQPIRCWAYWQSQTISKPLPAGPGARVRPSNPSCRAALASWVAILVETDSAAARVIVNAELCWSKDRCPAAVPLSERRSQRLRRHAPCSTCRSSSSTSLHLNDRDLSEFAPPRLGWTPRKDTEGKKTSASFL